MRGIAKMAMAYQTTNRGRDNGYESGYNATDRPESRRDRYGRYAPKNEYRSEYADRYRDNGGTYGMEHDKGWEVRPLEDEYRPENRYRPGRYRMNDDGGRMIGFENRTDDRRSERMEMHGGEHPHKETMETGHAEQMQEHTLDQRMAVNWVNRMENSDGSRGEHFTMEQTERIRKNKGWECDPLEFWVAMNAMWSDGAETAKKFGVDKLEYWAERAKEFITDKDAMPGKMSRYYRYIVKHDK